MLSGPSAAGATKRVYVGDNWFSPATADVAVGDTVSWLGYASSREAHSVRHVAGLFGSGEPEHDIRYSVAFSAGRFPYVCDVHVSLGMRGIVRVPVRIAPGPPGDAFRVAWATDSTQTGDAFDVQFRVGNGAWRPWMEATRAAGAVFGGARGPVRARDGVRYRFRARSRMGDLSSGWSPPRGFTP